MQHESINYLEWPSSDLALTKQFFNQVFDWTFTDYGPDYVAVNNANIDGGFFFSPRQATTANGSVLVVFYSNNLTATEQKIIAAGGEIVREIFEFPGGRRFHFLDLTGNEFAVWSDN
ncbi:MAG: VOC family protein [Gammaproteobacteria bacterium]|nr:VOC family protein [Gammaproteobacteria bacterium]NVK86578.1 VOC family protein [Gammaproteobacteria bacterium]